MYPLVSMALSLVLLAVLLRYKVRVGRAMFFAAVALALLLKVTPGQIWTELIREWQTGPLTSTSGYLFISLTALLLLVNVIRSTMREVGISQRLWGALHGLFRSRRLALSAIPMMMGLLPTPGGIMLSAPMVRDLGDQMGVERSHQAAINFFFRHQWESVWPLFPAVPLVQGILGVSAYSVISHNIAIPLFAFVGGGIFLLLLGMPAKTGKDLSQGRRFVSNVKDVVHVFWPIALAVGLYVGLNVPPALGILLGIIGLFWLHRIPRNRWAVVFKSGRELNSVLLIGSALLFKLILVTCGAVPGIKDFMLTANVPPSIIIFFLPFFVCFLTGVTMPTVAMTFPLLKVFIGTGSGAHMGLETLAFSGLLCGLCLTPVHLCLSLSSGYFRAPLSMIIARLLLPTAFIAAAGIAAAYLF